VGDQYAKKVAVDERNRARKEESELEDRPVTLASVPRRLRIH